MASLESGIPRLVVSNTPWSGDATWQLLSKASALLTILLDPTASIVSSREVGGLTHLTWDAPLLLSSFPWVPQKADSARVSQPLGYY